MKEIKIPNNWLFCRMQEIASIYNGNSISEEIKLRNFTGLTGGYNYIATKDIGFDSIINYENGVKIPFTRKDFKIAPKNTPLLCIEGGSAGRKLGFLSEDVCFGNKLCAFVSPFPRWIYYYLQSHSFRNHFNTNKNGLIGGVSINKLKQSSIPVPPMAEQKRIVKKIEELFGVIDEQVKRLEATRAALVSYRQSILKKLLSNPVYPQVSFNDGIKKIIGGSTPSKTISAYYEGHIPFMTVKDMTSPRPQDTAWHITQEAVDNCSTHIIPANTLITATRVGLGKTVLMPFPVAINQDLKALVLNKNKVNTRFFEFVLNAKTTEIISKSRGTTVKGITLEDFKSIKFYLPALAEQQKIVDEIERTFYSADQVQKAVQNALEQAKQLKQSILKRAFEGKLVPQDPNDKPVDLTQLKKDKHK